MKDLALRSECTPLSITSKVKTCAVAVPNPHGFARDGCSAADFVIGSGKQQNPLAPREGLFGSAFASAEVKSNGSGTTRRFDSLGLLIYDPVAGDVMELTASASSPTHLRQPTMTFGAIILLVASVAIIAAAAFLYTPDKPRNLLEAEYATPPSQFIRAAGLRLHIRDTGPKDGPAIVMLHGFASSLFTWEPWADAFSDKYRVVRFDLPGFGLTGPDSTGDYTDKRSMQVLAALMDALSIQRATLVGNSMGGRLAWMFAAECPERVSGLVLISPDGFADRRLRHGKKVKTLVRLLPYTLPKVIMRIMLAPAFGNSSALTDELLTRYRDMILSPGNRGAIIARRSTSEPGRSDVLLARIKAPTLLMWGEKDALIPVSNVEKYTKFLRDVRVVTFSALGHVPQEEAPVQSVTAALSFLDAVVAPAPA